MYTWVETAASSKKARNGVARPLLFGPDGNRYSVKKTSKCTTWECCLRRKEGCGAVAQERGGDLRLAAGPIITNLTPPRSSVGSYRGK